MAIVSLGSSSDPATYLFDSPFEIVSQGPGFWGGTSTSLVELPGNTLTGTEGHGTLQFLGTFDTFSWTITDPEDWHGFTFGIRTTEAIEPTPTPLPPTLFLFTFGLAAVGYHRRRIISKIKAKGNNCYVLPNST